MDTYKRIHRYTYSILKTGFISNLEKLNEYLQKESHLDKSKAYHEMVKDLQKYTKSKIQILEALAYNQVIIESDFWIIDYHLKKDQRLQEVSEHLQDILFSTEEIVHYSLGDFLPNHIKGLETYQQKLNENYKLLLPSCSLIYQQAEKLAEKVNLLKESLKQEDFTQASQLCQVIRKIVQLDEPIPPI